MAYDVIDAATEFSRDFEVDPKQGEYDGLLEKAIEFLQEEVNETSAAIAEEDLAEILDGFGDVAFIALNGIYKALRRKGCDHEAARAGVSEVMSRICRANLGKKHPDGTIIYKNGKVQKPEGWKPPQYEDFAA